MKKLFQGAEAVISEEAGAIIKERTTKGYRIKELDDSIRRKRTKSEARLLREARRCGVTVPYIIEENDYSLKLEKISGKKARDAFTVRAAAGMGSALAKLHSNGIIHGDFTTSNIILNSKSVFIVDFGLSFFSPKDEDKATDLFLLKENLNASHPALAAKAWNAFLKAYKKPYSGAVKAIKILSRIERRRRYKGEKLRNKAKKAIIKKAVMIT